MKKLLSILLAVFMTFGMFGIVCYADGEISVTDTYLTQYAYSLSGNKTYIIESGKTINVPSTKTLKVSGGAVLLVNGTLNVSTGATLEMASSATLEIGGTVMVLGYAKLYCDVCAYENAKLTIESGSELHWLIDSANTPKQLLLYGGGTLQLNGTLVTDTAQAEYIIKENSVFTVNSSFTLNTDNTLRINEGSTLNLNQSVTANGSLKSQGDINIKSGAVLTLTANSVANTISGSLNGGGRIENYGIVTVPEFEKLYLKDTTQFNIYNTLTVKGNVLSTGGELVVKCNADGTAGKIGNADRVAGNTSAEKQYYFAEVYYPGITPPTISDKSQVLQISYAYSTTGLISDDLTIDNWTVLNATTPTAIKVPLNQYLYFKMTYIDLVTGKVSRVYDATRMQVKFNGMVVSARSDKYVIEVLRAGRLEINPQAFLAGNAYLSDAMKDYEPFRKYRVYLPSGTGYSVVTREGNVSDNTSTLWFSYGKEISFRISLEDGYTDCEPALIVYLVQGYGYNEDLINEEKGLQTYPGATSFVEYNSHSGQPVPNVPYVDEYGYYHFIMNPELIDDSLTYAGYTLYVDGVVADSTIQTAGSVVELLKNIVYSIRGFFEAFVNAFGALFAFDF